MLPEPSDNALTVDRLAIPTFRTIVVPLDGSEFSARAIHAAAAIGRASDSDVHAVGIARDADEVASINNSVDQALSLKSITPTSTRDVIVGRDPTSVLLQLASDPSNILCLASHGHSKAVATIMNSVGSQLIDWAVLPLIVVGTNFDDTMLARDVVVALDGVSDPEQLLATAAGFALKLKAPLRIVTVYEPVLPDLRRPAHYSRSRGPSSDPEIYLEKMRRRANEFGLIAVDTAAIADPVSVVAGLAGHLERRPALLLVTGGRRRTGLRLTPGVIGGLLGIVSLPVLVVNRRP
jgi:nucleotide-binding universal stress UspA family protein